MLNIAARKGYLPARLRYDMSFGIKSCGKEGLSPEMQVIQFVPDLFDALRSRDDFI